MAKTDDKTDDANGVDAALTDRQNKRTPDEWARLFFPEGERRQQHKDAYLHGAAKALHKWDLYLYNTGTPFRLTQDDYVAAIRAVGKVQPDGSIQPHQGALAVSPAVEPAQRFSLDEEDSEEGNGNEFPPALGGLTTGDLRDEEKV